MNKKLITYSFSLLIVFTIICIPMWADELPSGVSIHRLDNGLEVLLIRNPGLPMTGANMVVKVGSAYETFATSGMSHMLEHLLFNGTTTRDQKELYDETDRIGGYNNANTSEYYTNYMMVTPAENFEKGMILQADMLFNSILPEKKFEKEKGIVLEEISKSLAEPVEQLERNLISVIYRGHSLSLPTLGTYSTIKSMSRDEVNSFYRNNYVPNNMILSVIGDFDTAEMLTKVNMIYGIYKASNIERPVNREWKTGFDKRNGENPVKGTFYRTYNGEEMIVHDLFMIKKNLTPSDVKLIELFLNRESGKVYKMLDSEFPEDIKDVKLILRNSSFINFIEVRTTLKKARDTENISAKIRSWMSGLILDPEGSEVKAEIIRSKTNFLMNIEKPHMFGIFNAANFALHGIESVLSLYGSVEMLSSHAQLKNISIDSPPLTIVQSPSPEKANISENKNTETRLFEDKEKGKSLIVTYNGGSNLLAIHYMFKHKAWYESAYGKDISKILHHCFGNRLKSEELLKKTSEYGLTFKVNDNPLFPMDDIYLHPDFGYIRVEGLADDVPSVIALINSELSGFKPSEEEFNRASQEISRTQSPMMMGNMAKKVFDKIYDSEVMEPSEFKAGQEEITYGNLLQFSEEYFRPDNIIVAVSSPRDTEFVNSLFDSFFIGNKGEKTAPWDPGFRLREQPVKIEKNGMGNRSYLFWGYSTKTDPADMPALQALSLYLSDKIIFDVREKRGMAYRMSAGIEMKGDKALFYINMGTRPENVDKLLPLFPAFFKKEMADGLTDKDLERLINMYLGRMKFRRLSSINRAFYLSDSLYFNDNINHDLHFFERLKKIKAINVKEAAKKYLGGINPLTIIVR